MGPALLGHDPRPGNGLGPANARGRPLHGPPPRSPLYHKIGGRGPPPWRHLFARRRREPLWPADSSGRGPRGDGWERASPRRRRSIKSSRGPKLPPPMMMTLGESGRRQPAVSPALFSSASSRPPPGRAPKPFNKATCRRGSHPSHAWHSFPPAPDGHPRPHGRPKSSAKPYSLGLLPCFPLCQ